MAVRIKGTGLSHMMTVPIDPETNDLLNQLATAHYQTKAAFVRSVLREWVEKLDVKNDEI